MKINIFCVYLYYNSKPYKNTPFTDIVAPVFKYVRWNQYSVYGIHFLMSFIQSQLFSL